MVDTGKGYSKLQIVVVGAFLVLGAFAVSNTDLDQLNVVDTDDGCWHKVSINNNTFSSTAELEKYASDRGRTVPGNLSFKTINGTVYQEAECIGDTVE